MRITLPSEQLYSIVGSLRSVCGSGGSIGQDARPCVRLSFSGEGCNFTACGGEIDEFRYHCPDAKIEGAQGDDHILLPVDKLHEIARSFSGDGEVSIHLDEDGKSEKVKINTAGQKAQYNLAPVSAMEFPQVDHSHFKDKVSLPETDLAHLFSMVSFSMASHDPRNYLNGVYLTQEEDGLCAVATNGHRLARSTTKTGQASKAGGDGSDAVILPRSLVLEFEKNARSTKKDDMVDLYLSETQVKVDFSNKTIVGRTLSGKYPDYKRVIPSDSAIKEQVTTNREEMSAALQKACAILVNLPSKDQSVELSFSKNKVSITTESGEGDKAEVPVDVEYSGEEIKIGFSSQYLADVLKTLETEKIVMQIQDPTSAVRFVGKDGGEDDYVIMPLRL